MDLIICQIVLYVWSHEITVESRYPSLPNTNKVKAPLQLEYSEIFSD